MWRTAWPLLAIVSLAAVSAPVRSETRPRYGGTLMLELHDVLTLTDPRDWPAPLVGLVYDRLVHLDDLGRPQPGLASAWTHDPENRRWQFTIRSGAKFQDGSLITAAAVRANLKSWSNVEISGQDTILIQTDKPAPDVPVELAGVRNAILHRGSDGVTIGSGPFRITEWQAGRHAVFTANEDYWGGRPFLDAVELTMGRTLRDQSIDLELGKADLVELSLDQARGAVLRGMRTWKSLPLELMTLVFEPGHRAVEDTRLRRAVALAIDRAAILNVLLERHGEPAGALLPQWMTGWAFLFPATRELERARDSAALIQPVPRLSLTHDASDPLARSIAERIALNAREAGVVIQVVPDAKADMRIARLRLRSNDSAQALADIARTLGLPQVMGPDSGTTEDVYAVEQKLLADFKVVPLFHLPATYGLSARVRNWQPAPWGNWHLENVWLEARVP
jgi:peptide/nickel transport system substrate-binding protein